MSTGRWAAHQFQGPTVRLPTGCLNALGFRICDIDDSVTHRNV